MNLIKLIPIAALAIALATPVSAESSKFVPISLCGPDMDFTFQAGWDINTHDVDQESFDENASAKALRAQASSVQKYCKTDAEREYANAYLFAWKAALDHRRGVPWKTDMNLGLQLLQKCVTRFYGTPKSAQCETDIDTNIHRKVTWESAEQSQ